MRDRQRFTLFDAMALVAAVALGFALIRAFALNRFLVPFDPIGMSPRSGERWNASDWTVWALATSLNRYYYLSPVLATLTSTVLALRLRQPRPALVRLMRQPGIAAMVAATWGMVLWLFAVAMSLLEPDHGVSVAYSFLAIIPASTVSSTWVILLLGRRWRPAPEWGDRLGRVLAVLWFLPLPLTLALMLAAILV